MSSVAINKTNVEKRKMTLVQRIHQYIVETSKVMAPGVFAMNNTYYRPAK